MPRTCRSYGLPRINPTLGADPSDLVCGQGMYNLLSIILYINIGCYYSCYE